MKKSLLNLLLAGTAMAVLNACGGEQEKKEVSVEPETVEAADTETWGFDSQGGNSYTVPSPNELFSIIKQSKLPYKEGLVGTEAANFTSSKNQALNFGRLTADIAYTASYEKFQESMSNFENLRKVGDDLGISYVFDEFMVNRVKSNMDNADSLEVISSSSYQKIIMQLEEAEKGSTLAIIAAGGFVESIYILSSMIGEYGESEELVQRLADQKLVMENVLDYLNLFSDEPRVQEVLVEIQPISDVFLNLDEEKVSEQITQEGDKTVLGGSRVIMTADEFNELKKAAADYRNSFSNPNQG
ncbi:MAG: hypothetical protein Salg2KO_20960 [Salibacteraceae bacterium]